jgi:hypothetical protein
MKKGCLYLFAVGVGIFLVQASGAARAPQAGAQTAPRVRPIGVVSHIGTGRFTLRTDAGPDLVVDLQGTPNILRVAPNAKDLKSAMRISPSEISLGDRVLVRGQISDDQKSILATSVIVMTRADIATAHVAESREWREHGIGGLVKGVNPASEEITIAVQNTPPTPGNATHPVTIALAPHAELLRYAPDSVKFSDAKPGAFQDIKVGDQVRALGTMNTHGTRYTAQEVVSGTFRNIAGTVISVDAAQGSVTIKDLATGQPLLVRTNADSKLHRLPPFMAMMIARFNSGGTPQGVGGPHEAGSAPAGGPAAGGASGANGARREGYQGMGRPEGQGRMGGGPGGYGGPPRDFNQMLNRTPALSLSELKSGDALIVVSAEGAKPSEVTAIVVLAGVEPILQARPKGSNEVALGPWNMSMGGGGGEEGP